ncbi:PREDICTED: splicing regulatory glutamine/lysine-rich protein 1-like [Nicotiana attenuata]|uniref:splicing regulatory glutamine/lysine-rich protein 1-like n=1 Tax=Nicotiana attenuata TaxID=49451 RepID=UPI000904FEBE|nr:PREDICTED: splicing regulatory glutamine/lysine-rich protein 1-like [Nicotiana attenuata]
MRVKMLARKTVATGALSSKLNAQLKASQGKDSKNSDDSFKSVSEREGTGSSDSEQATSVQNPSTEVISDLTENLENRFVLLGSVVDVETTELRRRGGENEREKETESEGVRNDEKGKGKEVADSSPTSETVKMAICGAEPEKVVESSKKTGGSGSGEAAEGLVNLRKHTDEPGSSIEETLADLLKKVGASYKPKKRRTPTRKTPGTARTNKKRTVSPETTDIPLPKGRATRSKLKQSEEALQKALEESKKKRIDKGKAKVSELVEASDVDKMDRVHQGEHMTVEMEVQTPKPKKAKTSSKKSSSVSKSAEPSTLAKRTRSGVKAKQVKITE